MPPYAIRPATEADLDTLVAFTIRQAQAAGALQLRLYVHRSSERAIRAYRRCGFEEAPYVMMTLRRDGEPDDGEG